MVEINKYLVLTERIHIYIIHMNYVQIEIQMDEGFIAN